jgi:iron-sulfur cluster repair protein YtfE (RIC family)
MIDLTNIRSEPMPEAMRVLLQDYPRDSWDANPHFKQATQNWLGAHQMFRRLGKIVRTETERYLERNRDPEDFAARLSYYGDALVRNLHGHHGWEDHSYFPELSAADPRFDAGIEILEKDHEALDAVLDQFTQVANRTIKLIRLDPPSAHSEAGALHTVAETIEAFLARHLSDEEELAVPIILHHRLRG